MDPKVYKVLFKAGFWFMLGLAIYNPVLAGECVRETPVIAAVTKGLLN